jgi:hypothetical protein
LTRWCKTPLLFCLQQLASTIPSQSSSSSSSPSPKKQSKSIIVRASIAHHAEQRQRSLLASVEIRKLLAERSDLLREVNELRMRSTRKGPRSLDRNEEQERERNRVQVFNVETESFMGTSPNDWGEGEETEMVMTEFHAGEITPSAATVGAASFSFPLDVTPFNVASPTPSQVTRLLQHLDDDLLRIAPM